MGLHISLCKDPDRIALMWAVWSGSALCTTVCTQWIVKHCLLCLFLWLIFLDKIIRNWYEVYVRAPDKRHTINFNWLHLCYFFAGSCVWPLAREDSSRWSKLGLGMEMRIIEMRKRTLSGALYIHVYRSDYTRIEKLLQEKACLGLRSALQRLQYVQ